MGQDATMSDRAHHKQEVRRRVERHSARRPTRRHSSTARVRRHRALAANGLAFFRVLLPVVELEMMLVDSEFLPPTGTDDHALNQKALQKMLDTAVGEYRDPDADM
jgi:hypothetical protein